MPKKAGPLLGDRPVINLVFELPGFENCDLRVQLPNLVLLLHVIPSHCSVAVTGTCIAVPGALIATFRVAVSVPTSSALKKTLIVQL